MYKFNKEQLLAESQELGFDEIGFDEILEAVEVDEETRTMLSEALVLASRSGAVKILESHLDKLVESAEAQVAGIETQLEEKFDNLLAESVEDFLVSVGDEWLQENEVAIENTAKTQLLDGLMEDLKGTFIKHNISVPDDKIDLVEELALEEQETREIANTIKMENKALREELDTMKRNILVDKLSEGMTVSQKETFSDLAMAVKLDSNYESRITKLSESLIISKAEPTASETALVESLKAGSKVQTHVETQVNNSIEKGEQSLNEGANKTPNGKTEEQLRDEQFRRQMQL